MNSTKQSTPFDRLRASLSPELAEDPLFLADLQESATVITLRKGESLLHVGELCSCAYFINRGLLVNLFITDKGNECVTSFASDYQYPFLSGISYITQKPSDFEIRALEESELICISKESVEGLSKRYPAFLVYYTHILQLLIAKQQTLFAVLQSYTAEEFIEYLYSAHPWIINRVPDKYIAHFMSISTSWFCKLKKRIVKRS